MMPTDRELFLLVICAVIYAVLFVVTVQNSRRKIGQLEERLRKIRAIEDEHQSASNEGIEANRQRMEQLQQELQQMGSENTMLRLQLEQQQARLDYMNKVALLEREKREAGEAMLFSSPVYLRLEQSMEAGRSMGADDWQELSALVDSVYTGFTDRLYGLYRMSQQDYRVSLLVKLRLQPKDIATLTAHSKESVASTRSRLYAKIFGKKGRPRDWDEFVLSL